MARRLRRAGWPSTRPCLSARRPQAGTTNDAPQQPTPGFRLARLELHNWGTFDDLVWTLRADGRNTLVTGDIGSGKSTIVDAITTLLLPANRISYNKAAGAETKERSLRSYVLGHYKSEQNETTGTTRPVALRDATKFSVILGVFTNEGYDATVTLAQVFWMKNGDIGGQPDRFYVTADSALSIAGDFLEFGGDMTRLRKRLQGHRRRPAPRRASPSTAGTSAAASASSPSRPWSCSTRPCR